MDGFGATIAARIDRWTRFLDGHVPARLFVIRYAPGLGVEGRPLPNPSERQARLDWMRASYEWHLARTEWLDDDSLPCLDLFTGTELFAEAFGCPVSRPADSNPFALPLVRSAPEADRLRAPTLDAEPLARVFELADTLRGWAGPRAIVRLPDQQSPFDIAALIWEKQSFYTALVDDPGAVERLVAEVEALQFSFLDEWFGRYGRPAVAHFPDYLLPRGASLSADEAGGLSPAMFDRFVLPDLSAFSARYGGLGIHCCAHARHQWEGFARVPGLLLLNLHQGEPVLRDAYRRFAPVTAQWHFSSDPSVPHRPREADLPDGARVVVEAVASSRDEALGLSAKLARFAGR